VVTLVTATRRCHRATVLTQRPPLNLPPLVVSHAWLAPLVPCAHRRPARYLEQVLAQPTSRACVRSVTCGPACGDTATAAASCGSAIGRNARVDCPIRSCSASVASVMLSSGDLTEHSAAGDLPPLAGGSHGSGVSAPFVHPRAGTRGYHEPNIEFPPQKCHACSSEEVFYTRTSFTNHLKGHGLFWKKTCEYAQLRRGSGGGGPAARGVKHSRLRTAVRRPAYRCCVRHSRL